MGENAIGTRLEVNSRSGGCGSGEVREFTTCSITDDTDPIVSSLTEWRVRQGSGSTAYGPDSRLRLILLGHRRDPSGCRTGRVAGMPGILPAKG